MWFLQLLISFHLENLTSLTTYIFAISHVMILWDMNCDQSYKDYDSRGEICNGPPRLSICHQRAVHKRKKSQIVLNTTTYFVLNYNVLALLSFYALPSGGNRKTRWSIGHRDILLMDIFLTGIFQVHKNAVYRTTSGTDAMNKF